MILITINSNEYIISDRHPNRPITYVSDSDELEKYPNSFSPLIQHSKGSSYAACSEHDGIIYSVESGVNTDVSNTDTYTTILTIKDGGNPRSIVVDTSASERFLSGESAIIKNGSDIFIIAMYVADTSLYCYKYDPLTESASLVNVILSIKAFQHSEELGILLTQHTSNAVYPYRFDNISDTFVSYGASSILDVVLLNNNTPASIIFTAGVYYLFTKHDASDKVVVHVIDTVAETITPHIELPLTTSFHIADVILNGNYVLMVTSNRYIDNYFDINSTKDTVLYSIRLNHNQFFPSSLSPGQLKTIYISKHMALVSLTFHHRQHSSIDLCAIEQFVKHVQDTPPPGDPPFAYKLNYFRFDYNHLRQIPIINNTLASSFTIDQSVISDNTPRVQLYDIASDSIALRSRRFDLSCIPIQARIKPSLRNVLGAGVDDIESTTKALSGSGLAKPHTDLGTHVISSSNDAIVHLIIGKNVEDDSERSMLIYRTMLTSTSTFTSFKLYQRIALGASQAGDVIKDFSNIDDKIMVLTGDEIIVFMNDIYGVFYIDHVLALPKAYISIELFKTDSVVKIAMIVDGTSEAGFDTYEYHNKKVSLKYEYSELVDAELVKLVWMDRIQKMMALHGLKPGGDILSVASCELLSYAGDRWLRDQSISSRHPSNCRSVRIEGNEFLAICDRSVSLGAYTTSNMMYVLDESSGLYKAHIDVYPFRALADIAFAKHAGIITTRSAVEYDSSNYNSITQITDYLWDDTDPVDSKFIVNTGDDRISDDEGFVDVFTDNVDEFYIANTSIGDVDHSLLIIKAGTDDVISRIDTINEAVFHNIEVSMELLAEIEGSNENKPGVRFSEAAYPSLVRVTTQTNGGGEIIYDQHSDVANIYHPLNPAFSMAAASILTTTERRVAVPYASHVYDESRNAIVGNDIDRISIGNVSPSDYGDADTYTRSTPTSLSVYLTPANIVTMEYQFGFYITRPIVATITITNPTNAPINIFVKAMNEDTEFTTTLLNNVTLAPGEMTSIARVHLNDEHMVIVAITGDCILRLFGI